MLATAFTSAALFTGAATVISIAEHPARMKLDESAALKQWAPSYKKAATMQASLVIVCGLAGLVSWWGTGSLLILLATLVMAANFPFTMIVIMPINRRLLDRYQGGHPRDLHNVRQMLEQWGRLHAVRTVLGLTGTMLFFVALC